MRKDIKGRRLEVYRTPRRAAEFWPHFVGLRRARDILRVGRYDRDGIRTGWVNFSLDGYILRVGPISAAFFWRFP